MLKLLLMPLSNELTNLEMKMTVFVNAHVNIKQELEQITAQKDVIAEEAAQVLTLGIKMSHAREVIEEFVENILEGSL